MMKRVIILLFTVASACWSIPKPMESITNYNVLLLHGAYGNDQGFLEVTNPKATEEAYKASAYLDNGASLGRYHEDSDDKHRLLRWISHDILEEPYFNGERAHPKNSYIYSWRSFSKPANSSINNAIELGKRTWSMPGTSYSKRRALVEEGLEFDVL